MKATLLKIFAIVLFACSASFAQQVSLVKDINNSLTTNGSNPYNTVALGSSVVFVANDPLTGSELWISNGAALGTTLIKDIYVGGYGSGPSGLTNIGGVIYFSANDGVNGRELWKTDGTTAGTVLVKDINTGPASSSPVEFTLFSGSVYFRATTVAEGSELWKTNGTTAGTLLVEDINVGNSGSTPRDLEALGSAYLIFRATTTTNGQELYSYNGGTINFLDIVTGTGSSSPSGLTYNASLGLIFFQAYNATYGYELWKTNGDFSTGTSIIDIETGSGSSYPGYITSQGSFVYFQAYRATTGFELYRSNGTTTPFALVGSELVVGAGSSNPSYLTATGGGGLFFHAWNGSNYALFYTTGGAITAITNTTGMYMYQIIPNPSSANVYFSAYTATNGYEFWTATSTTATLVKDIIAGTGSSYPYYLAFAGSVFFQAYDATKGYELWVSDLSSAGTVIVKDINGATDSNVYNSIATSTGFLLSANNGVNGQELWKSDLTSLGTVLIEDILPGASGSYPEFLGKLGTTYFFSAYDDINGQELWKSDGATTGGTLLLMDIEPGINGSYPYQGVVIGSNLYFVAYTSTNGYEIWKTNGTTTSLLFNVNAGSGSSYPYYLTAVGSTLFFYADDGINGYELWKSDGTTTSLVKNINLSGSSYPEGLTNVNGTLFFSADDGVNGYELWKSDGSSAGTVSVKDINTSAGASSYPYNITALGSTAYFNADNGTNGTELWKSDGTGPGTVLVKDIYTGTGSSSYPYNLTVANGKLYFVAYEPSTGYEVYKSDGTDANTTILRDIRVGSANSNASNLTNLNETLYFTASDGITGNLLYKSNGATAFKATSGGEAYELPGQARYYNGKIAFTANTNTFGNEPLTVMAEPLNQPTALNFTGRTATSISASFTAAAGSPAAPSGYLVIRKAGSAPTDLPIDGTTYTVGATLGTSVVAAIGSGTLFTDTFTASSTPSIYYYAVYSYNNDGTANIYRSVSPLQGNNTPLAAEPSAQPTALISTSITTTSFTVSFTAATGAPTGYIALRKAGSIAPTELPVDGIAYTAGADLGTSKVAYVGAATTFNQTALTAATAYSYAIYSYNGAATTLNYLPTTPLTGTISTLVAEPTAQPIGLVFSGNTPTSIGGSFTAASPAPTGGYIVVRNTTATIAAPVDGTAYTAGAALTGVNTVVFVGTGTTFTDNFALSAGTTYFYAVYSFNGSGGTTNYLTTTPLTGNSTTPVVEPTAQPTAFVVTALTTTSFTVSFTAAAGSPNGYIALRKAGATAPTDLPVDGVEYTLGATIGTSTVAFLGDFQTTTFNQTGLTAGSSYSYAIFSANGSTGTWNYLTTIPLTGTASTIAAEPTAQPTSLVFSNVALTSLTGTFTAASGPPSGYIAIRKKDSAPTGIPADGTAYVAGNVLGDAVVAYFGPAATFNDSGLTSESIYHYQVFSFNGSGPTINYLTASPLSNSQLLLGTPPVITNETAATIGSPTTQLKVVASVVENESSLPAGSVKIEHRSISAGGAFSTPENMTLTVGKWEFTLPVASNGELGAEYKITATNSQGLSANVTGKATLTYSGTGMIIPYNSFGTEQTNYRIISIPLVLDPKTVAAVLEDDLGALKKDVWRIFNYSGTSNVEMNASSTIEPGKGYWLIAKTSASLDTGPGATVPTTQSFSVPLVSGWNLIGNPYTFNVLWSDVLTASGLPATTKIVTYDGAYNLTGDTKIDKFEGGFVNVLSASDLKFPVTKNPAAGRESGTQTAQRKNSIDQSDWEVIINLKNDGKILGMGGVGMNENAKLREDIYDEFTVPRFFEYVEMNHNKRFINSAYAKDIVPTQQNHEWDFTVETNLIGNTNLEWDNSYFGNNEAWLVLWDVEEQRAVDMKKENSYSLNGKKSKTFRAFYGNKEFIDGKTAVSSLLVHSLSPNPTNGQTKIGFSLPGTEEATVQVRVLNMMGQAVAAVFDGSLPGGYNEVTWSGKDNLETKPAGGIYLVEIRALNQTRVAKLIIN